MKTTPRASSTAVMRRACWSSVTVSRRNLPHGVRRVRARRRSVPGRDDVSRSAALRRRRVLPAERWAQRGSVCPGPAAPAPRLLGRTAAGRAQVSRRRSGCPRRCSTIPHARPLPRGRHRSRGRARPPLRDTAEPCSPSPAGAGAPSGSRAPAAAPGVSSTGPAVRSCAGRRDGRQPDRRPLRSTGGSRLPMIPA